MTACLLVIAMLATGYLASRRRLPDPATTDREGLMRWLVLGDLREERTEVRKTLLVRLQAEAAQGLGAADLGNQLDRVYRDRLWANILVLIETWYSGKVDEFSTSLASERIVCLDRAVDEIRGWKELAALRPKTGAGPSGDNVAGTMLGLIAQQVEIWKESAPPQRRQEIVEFDAALRARWVMHALGLASTAHQ